MNAAPWPAPQREALGGWLASVLDAADAVALVPHDDPLRGWWAPEPASTAVRRLFDLLVGGQDLTSLAAMVERARCVSPLPAGVQAAWADELARAAAASRGATAAVARGEGDERDDIFLAYAHEDTGRALAISRLLRAQGVSLFRDVERIRPGESITTRLHQALSRVAGAVVIVSRHARASAWVTREVAQLLQRRARSPLKLLPVLIDDVDLPAELADVFTIDLRGYTGAQDDGWAGPRLQPLVRAIIDGGTGTRPTEANP